MPEYAFSQTPQLMVEPPSAGFLHFGMRFAVLPKLNSTGISVMAMKKASITHEEVAIPMNRMGCME